MAYRAVLFDLDGTLLDTLSDIASAANAVLARFGFPAHPEDDYRHFIGDGVGMLFRRALPPGRADDATVARCVDAQSEEYGRSWNVRSRPYDGIPDLLDALTARGLALAILSNKVDDFTRRMADEYLARWPFRVVLGQREGSPRKPDPAGAVEVAARLGLPPGDFLYLGDTAVDMATALGAGMHPVGAAWGFRTVEELRGAGAEAVIDRPLDLLGLL